MRQPGSQPVVGCRVKLVVDSSWVSGIKSTSNPMIVLLKVVIRAFAFLQRRTTMGTTRDVWARASFRPSAQH